MLILHAFNSWERIDGKSFCFVFLPFADRPWLTEGQKVQKLQEKVYLALQHSLHKSVASDEKLDKVATRVLRLYVPALVKNPDDIFCFHRWCPSCP